MKDVCRKLGEDTTNYFAFLGRSDEPVFETLERKTESMGIQAGQVEYSGLKVANANWVLGNIAADVVRFAVGTWLDSGASHPHSEGMGMMVTPVEALFQG